MSRGLLLSLSVALFALSCGEDATGPVGSLCATQHGLEVCVDRSEYEPRESITVTTRNVSGARIFKDSCATKPVGVTNLEVEFEAFYNPTLHCGRGATRADILEHMVELEPGASTRETVTLPFFSFQGWYRVNVWLLDAEGDLAVDTPAASGIFQVFPSVGE
ncbi:MAG: hypothetical protein OXI39_14300 [Gemmatimonadota bacterium]|uniref:hypothetical protein n=1 Tax=Candidatus Palauibacter scopulicola TaxID=3056741 RepID=UPI00239B3987|nr:hypothetical protein [Candidatus Palauibacter scopulicola]MDE2664157.1 hypothetical protein [Candidatus Palauibacter scopulicola]